MPDIKSWSSPPRQMESAYSSQNGEGQVPVVRLMKRSGLARRRSLITEMAASKTRSPAAFGEMDWRDG